VQHDELIFTHATSEIAAPIVNAIERGMDLGANGKCHIWRMWSSAQVGFETEPKPESNLVHFSVKI